MSEIKLSIDEHKPSKDPRCARCKVMITEHNDSGWWVFVAGGMSQKICLLCDEQDDNKGELPKMEQS